MVTLRTYLDGTGCPGELADLICLIADQAIPIRRAFVENQDYAGTVNVSGEQQAALDTWADGHITEVLKRSGLVAELASEEQAEAVQFPDARTDYAVVMDPLDGSSLIKVNLAVGTIVGIYSGGGVLQKGEGMIAAFYMLYGPMTVLTLTVGDGVQIFTLGEDSDYHLLKKDVRMPEGTLYGSGGLKKDWTEEHSVFIEAVESEGFKLRYSGSFVADFHQILIYGGFYCYPALIGKPDGKLRLLFEGNPIGFIAQQAGGAASSGTESLLSISPSAIHQRTPIYVGSSGVIQRLEDLMKK